MLAHGRPLFTWADHAERWPTVHLSHVLIPGAASRRQRWWGEDKFRDFVEQVGLLRRKNVSPIESAFPRTLGCGIAERETRFIQDRSKKQKTMDRFKPGARGRRRSVRPLVALGSRNLLLGFDAAPRYTRPPW